MKRLQDKTFYQILARSISHIQMFNYNYDSGLGKTIYRFIKDSCAI